MIKRVYLIIIIIIIMFLAPLVSSLGVTPGRTTLDFAANSIITVDFEVINTEKQDVDIVVLVQGELNKSISLSQVSFKMLASESSKKLSYTITMPERLSPGSHAGEVVILQLPKNSGEGTFVGSAVGVITQIFINVPYPGKYAEASMNIVGPGKDGQVQFIVPVFSKGKLDIRRAKANIDIYTSLNEKIASITTQELPLTSLGVIELAAPWNTATAPTGRYRAVATVIYDEETATAEKEFTLGEQTLALRNIEVNDFTLGEIAKFELLVENMWSEPVLGAYVQMNIFNKEGEVMADFKSQTYDFESKESKLMVAFWDTDGVKKDKYDSSLFLRFGQQSLQQDLEIRVSDNEINIVGVGYVISESDGGGNSLIIILYTIIGILVLVNILWFLVLRKRFAKK